MVGFEIGKLVLSLGELVGLTMNPGVRLACRPMTVGVEVAVICGYRDTFR